MVVAITGLGIISPYGSGPSPLMEGLLRGLPARSGRRLVKLPGSTADFAITSVDDRDVTAALGTQPRRGLNPEIAILLAAACLAMADAGLEHEQGDATGVAVSTRHAGLQDYAELFQAGISHEVGAINPARGPLTGLNAPAAYLSIRLRARGPNMTMSNGAVGGLDALAYGVEALHDGHARRMLVGGVEAHPPVAGEQLATRDHATTVIRGLPFDRRRRGPALGEAGVVVVLEEASQALRRGARVRAQVSVATNAFSPSDDLVEASRRSLTQALDAGSTDHNAVAAAFAGANGSIAGDAAEAHALYQLFGGRVPICAIKGAVAEAGGAGGLTQVAIAALCLERRILPPTIGFQLRDPQLPALRILTSPQALGPGPVLVHSWDEACCSASVVMRDYRPALGRTGRITHPEGGSRAN